MIIAVDFDGTMVCTTKFPDKFYNIGAGPVLRFLQKYNDLYTWTLRGDTVSDWQGNKCPKGTYLDYVRQWADSNGVQFKDFNRTPDHDWTDSPKHHADIFIDDLALGAPLRTLHIEGQVYKVIDWEQVMWKLLGVATPPLSELTNELIECYEQLKLELSIYK